MGPDTLIERYSHRLGVSPEEARRRLFLNCVPPGRRLLVKLCRVVRPRLYQMDLRLIDEAGAAPNVQGVVDALDRWQHRAASVQSVVRDRWHLRVSGRNLIAVAMTLFAEADPIPAATTPPVRSSGVVASVAPPLVTDLVASGSSEVPDAVRAHG